MVKLTVENLDSEAEKLTKVLNENSVDVSFENVRATLLHLNKDSFTDEEYYSLFEPSEDEQTNIITVLNGVLNHNVLLLGRGNLNELMDFKDFCRNENGYKVIKELDKYAMELAKAINKDSKNINKEIMKSLEPLNGLVTGEEQIKVGNETFKFADLTDGSKIITSYFGLIADNYVNSVCKSQYLTDETKQFCDDVHDYTFILSNDSFYELSANTTLNEQYRTR